MNVSAQQVAGSAVDGVIEDIGLYRQVLGAFMTGVTVITTLDQEGRQRGITANSFTSVSLDPPLVLFCVDYRAASYETFQNAEGFVVHILGSEQQELARTFASKSEQKFAGITTAPGVSGAPILPGVHGWLDCTLHDVVIAGDHAIVIGEVQRYSAEPARPLGFYQGRFFGFNNDQEIGSLIPHSAPIAVGWMMQSQGGAIVAARTESGFALPSSRLRANQIHSEALIAEAGSLFDTLASVEFLYSVYEGGNDQLSLVYRGQVFADAAEIEKAGFVCLDPGRVDPAAFTRPGEAAVVGRYLEELVGERFGVYAGTLAEGSIARVADVAADTRSNDDNE